MVEQFWAGSILFLKTTQFYQNALFKPLIFLSFFFFPNIISHSHSRRLSLSLDLKLNLTLTVSIPHSHRLTFSISHSHTQSHGFTESRSQSLTVSLSGTRNEESMRKERKGFVGVGIEEEKSPSELVVAMASGNWALWDPAMEFWPFKASVILRPWGRERENEKWGKGFIGLVKRERERERERERVLDEVCWGGICLRDFIRISSGLTQSTVCKEDIESKNKSCNIWKIESDLMSHAIRCIWWQTNTSKGYTR